MEITFAPKGILQINGARIIFKNFEGRGDRFNREGDRNFAMIIPHEEDANTLQEAGWNVKIKPPREDGDEPFMYLPVKVKFNDMVDMLDEIDIANVDLDIRPYDWDINGKEGRTAYLQSMEVTQNIDRFAARYAEEEHPEE